MLQHSLSLRSSLGQHNLLTCSDDCRWQSMDRWSKRLHSQTQHQGKHVWADALLHTMIIHEEAYHILQLASGTAECFRTDQDNSTCRWQIPSNYFLKDFTVNGVTIRGIFVDSNPFITKYNGSAKYYRQYFIEHVSLCSLAFDGSPHPVQFCMATLKF